MRTLILCLLLMAQSSWARDFTIKHSLKGEDHVLVLTSPSKIDLNHLEFHVGFLSSARICLKSEKKYTHIKEFGPSGWLFDCRVGKGDEISDLAEQLRHSCLTEDANDDVRELCAEVMPQLKKLVPKL